MGLTKKLAAFICLLFIVALKLPAQNRAATDIYYHTGKVQPYMANYEEDRGLLLRFYVIANSPERRARLESLAGDYKKRLQSLNFNEMSASDKVDFILFTRTLDNELRTLKTEEQEFNQVSKYVPFADSIYRLEKIRRRGGYLNSQQVAATLNTIKSEVGRLSGSLKSESNMPKHLSNRAEATVRGLQAALKSVHDFYYGYDPAFTWWVAQPYKDLDSSLNSYAGQLRSKIAKEETVKDDSSGIIGNPIGREELIRQLQYEMIPYTPDELVEIANKEFAWCDAEMLKVSKEMGFVPAVLKQQ